VSKKSQILLVGDDSQLTFAKAMLKSAYRNIFVLHQRHKTPNQNQFDIFQAHCTTSEHITEFSRRGMLQVDIDFTCKIDNSIVIDFIVDISALHQLHMKLSKMTTKMASRSVQHICKIYQNIMGVNKNLKLRNWEGSFICISSRR